MAILNYLKNTTSHPDAEKTYQALKKQFPNLSLATVYRNLNYLASMGLIEALTTNQSSTHFDGDNSTHFHFVCNDCGQISDIFEKDLINLALIQNKFNLINKINLNINGTCNHCGTK